MKNEFDPKRLDVKTLAQAGGDLSGDEPLSSWPRLRELAQGQEGGQNVRWEISGELRRAEGHADEVWLHLRVDASLPTICQRCLEPMEVALQFSRSFRFVADEETAAALDAEAEEDVLVLSRTFDLLELIEDELLMEAPVVPRHEQCPTEVKLSVVDDEFEQSMEAATNPFDILASLKTGR